MKLAAKLDDALSVLSFRPKDTRIVGDRIQMDTDVGSWGDTNYHLKVLAVLSHDNRQVSIDARIWRADDEKDAPDAIYSGILSALAARLTR